MSAIEWTNQTWNPATGCTKISQGCKNCYAATLSKRLKAMGQKKYRNEFEYTEHEDYIDEPLKWKKPRKVFVNSMSDLFHENATDEFLHKVFYVMRQCPQHQFQILTKRPDRMRRYIESLPTVIPKHIWIGTSIESPQHLDRLTHLKNTNAFVKFISFEPLLERIGNVNLTGIDWVIVGGESGLGFRDVIQKEWVEELRDICKYYDVAFFFKQWGGRFPKEQGRELNGKIYDEYPTGKIQNR